jgi:hypothetical protein
MFNKDRLLLEALEIFSAREVDHFLNITERENIPIADALVECLLRHVAGLDQECWRTLKTGLKPRPAGETDLTPARGRCYSHHRKGRSAECDKARRHNHGARSSRHLCQTLASGYCVQLNAIWARSQRCSSCDRCQLTSPSSCGTSTHAWQSRSNSLWAAFQSLWQSSTRSYSRLANVATSYKARA